MRGKDESASGAKQKDSKNPEGTSWFERLWARGGHSATYLLHFSKLPKEAEGGKRQGGASLPDIGGFYS